MITHDERCTNYIRLVSHSRKIATETELIDDSGWALEYDTERLTLNMLHPNTAFQNLGEFTCCRRGDASARRGDASCRRGDACSCPSGRLGNAHRMHTSSLKLPWMGTRMECWGPLSLNIHHQRCLTFAPCSGWYPSRWSKPSPFTPCQDIFLARVCCSMSKSALWFLTAREDERNR